MDREDVSLPIITGLVQVHSGNAGAAALAAAGLSPISSTRHAAVSPLSGSLLQGHEVAARSSVVLTPSRFNHRSGASAIGRGSSAILSWDRVFSAIRTLTTGEADALPEHDPAATAAAAAYLDRAFNTPRISPGTSSSAMVAGATPLNITSTSGSPIATAAAGGGVVVGISTNRMLTHPRHGGAGTGGYYGNGRGTNAASGSVVSAVPAGAFLSFDAAEPHHSHALGGGAASDNHPLASLRSTGHSGPSPYLFSQQQQAQSSVLTQGTHGSSGPSPYLFSQHQQAQYALPSSGDTARVSPVPLYGDRSIARPGMWQDDGTVRRDAGDVGTAGSRSNPEVLQQQQQQLQQSQAPSDSARQLLQARSAANRRTGLRPIAAAVEEGEGSRPLLDVRFHDTRGMLKGVDDDAAGSGSGSSDSDDRQLYSPPSVSSGALSAAHAAPPASVLQREVEYTGGQQQQQQCDLEPMQVFSQPSGLSPSPTTSASPMLQSDGRDSTSSPGDVAAARTMTSALFNVSSDAAGLTATGVLLNLSESEIGQSESSPVSSVFGLVTPSLTEPAITAITTTTSSEYPITSEHHAAVAAAALNESVEPLLGVGLVPSFSTDSAGVAGRGDGGTGGSSGGRRMGSDEREAASSSSSPMQPSYASRPPHNTSSSRFATDAAPRDSDLRRVNSDLRRRETQRGAAHAGGSGESGGHEPLSASDMGDSADAFEITQRGVQQQAQQQQHVAAPLAASVAVPVTQLQQQLGQQQQQQRTTISVPITVPSTAVPVRLADVVPMSSSARGGVRNEHHRPRRIDDAPAPVPNLSTAPAPALLTPHTEGVHHPTAAPPMLRSCSEGSTASSTSRGLARVLQTSSRPAIVPQLSVPSVDKAWRRSTSDAPIPSSAAHATAGMLTESAGGLAAGPHDLVVLGQLVSGGATARLYAPTGSNPTAASAVIAGDRSSHRLRVGHRDITVTSVNEEATSSAAAAAARHALDHTESPKSSTRDALAPHGEDFDSTGRIPTLSLVKSRSQQQLLRHKPTGGGGATSLNTERHGGAQTATSSPLGRFQGFFGFTGMSLRGLTTSASARHLLRSPVSTLSPPPHGGVQSSSSLASPPFRVSSSSLLASGGQLSDATSTVASPPARVSTASTGGGSLSLIAVSPLSSQSQSERGRAGSRGGLNTSPPPRLSSIQSFALQQFSQTAVPLEQRQQQQQQQLQYQQQRAAPDASPSTMAVPPAAAAVAAVPFAAGSALGVTVLPPVQEEAWPTRQNMRMLTTSLDNVGRSRSLNSSISGDSNDNASLVSGDDDDDDVSSSSAPPSRSSVAATATAESSPRVYGDRQTADRTPRKRLGEETQRAQYATAADPSATAQALGPTFYLPFSSATPPQARPLVAPSSAETQNGGSSSGGGTASTAVLAVAAPTAVSLHRAQLTWSPGSINFDYLSLLFSSLFRVLPPEGVAATELAQQLNDRLSRQLMGGVSKCLGLLGASLVACGILCFVVPSLMPDARREAFDLFTGGLVFILGGACWLAAQYLGTSRSLGLARKPVFVSLAVVSLVVLIALIIGYVSRVLFAQGVLPAAPRLSPSESALWAFVIPCCTMQFLNYSYIPFRLLLVALITLLSSCSIVSLAIATPQELPSIFFGCMFLLVNAVAVTIASYLRESSLRAHCAMAIAAKEAESDVHEVLRNLMPAPVVDRIMNGEGNACETHSGVAILVSVPVKRTG